MFGPIVLLMCQELLQKVTLWCFMALCQYIYIKLGNWPVGGHVIRLATGVHKHKPVCNHEFHTI